MFINEFIRQQYPIDEILKQRLRDPRKAVADADNLPYDVIAMDENGNLVKQVEITDTKLIPVVELISYTEEEAVALKDADFLNAYQAYMRMVDVDDISIADIMSSARRHSDIRKRREEMLAKSCTT